MKLKVYLLIIISIFMIQAFCDSEDPGKNINLPVPYHAQIHENYCGIACIQMWADFDKRNVTQEEIADFLGIEGQFVSPTLLEQGVSYFTNSQAYLASELMTEPDAQENLIAATISGIKDYTPSIMPFFEDHAVLIKGYKWHEDINGRPIADRAYVHDPDNLPDRDLSAASLKALFMASPFSYWVIVGQYSYIPEGREGYNIFILEGGTYYGAPSSRDPLPQQ